MLKRSFLPSSFVLKTWMDIEPYYDNLKNRSIGSKAELETWLHVWSETDAVLSENGGWRYIKMTCNLEDAALQEDYRVFVEEIAPKTEVVADALKRKLIESPFLNELDASKYFIFIREIKKDLELFKLENVDLQAKLMVLQQKYASIAGAMTIQYEGQELTLARASTLLKSEDRTVRENVYHLIQERRIQDAQILDDLFSEMIALRHQIALNAGFSNFRDYKMKSLGRFDYTVQDCFNFHNSIREHVLPVLDQLNQIRKEKLGLATLNAWDLDVKLPGEPELHPFKNAEELIEKTIACFGEVSSEFQGFIEVMKEKKHLDLDSRKGKAPGGYNYPLSESGIPFIFMNSVGLNRDLVTMVHEGGHAVHAFLADHLELDAFKQCPSEVAELASMSMELISMEHWQVFYPNAEDMQQARREHLESIIRILPWIALVDKFQHWVYENPTHTHEERKREWLKLSSEFSSTITEKEGLEKYREHGWKSQLHIFEVPFYYIEYGIAQLGALSIWKNYIKDRRTALQDYANALKLGYTKTIPEIYNTANVKFDFSSENIKELVSFLRVQVGES